MSQQYDNTNSGALFVNDKGDNDKRPDRRGTINIEGVEYTLSGWLRTPNNGGAQFLSLKAERKDGAKPQRQAPQAPAQQQKRESTGRPIPEGPDMDPCPF